MSAASWATEDNTAPSAPAPQTTTTRMEIDPLNDAFENSSESDESGMVIINKNEVPVGSTDLPPAERQEKVKKDWFKRSKIEFPKKSAPNPARVDEQLRGRNPARPALQINPNVSRDILSGNTSPSSPKRRFLSLAPIKTIFPSLSAVQQHRAVSATASPVSPKSPYSASKLFFRSTYSLNAASALQLPPSSTPSGSKTESLPRRLFSYKGKERAKDIDVPEELEDNWEDLGKTVDDESANMVAEAGEQHPQSLMSIVVDSMSDNGTTTMLSKKAQTNSSIPPLTSSSDRSHSTQANTLLQDATKDVSKSSLVQETIQIRTVDERIPTTSSQSEVEAEELGSTPIATTPTSPMPTAHLHPIISNSQWLSSSTSPHRSVPSPLRLSTLPIVSIEPHTATTERDTQLEGLETFLPMTPIYCNHFEQRVPLIADDLKEQLPPPLVPVAAWRSPARSIPDLLTNMDPTSSAEPITVCSCNARKNVTTVTNDMSSSPLSFSAYPSYPPRVSTTNSMKASPSLDEYITPSKHHYVGRPLPPPPPIIDAKTAKQKMVVAVKNDSPTTPCSPASHSIDSEESDESRDTGRLLIDLEDTSLDIPPFSPSSTIRLGSDESRYPSQVYLPLIPSPASSVDFANEYPSSELTDLVYTHSSMHSPKTLVQSSPGRAPSPIHFQRHQFHHSQHSLPSSHHRRNIFRPCALGPLPHFSDGVHDTICCGMSSNHHVRRGVDPAHVRDNFCSCEPHSALPWSPHGLTSPSLVSIPTFGYDVNKPQHCKQCLSADTVQRQRQHVAHLAY